VIKEDGEKKGWLDCLKRKPKEVSPFVMGPSRNKPNISPLAPENKQLNDT
jgi:hypothetical protein